MEKGKAGRKEDIEAQEATVRGLEGRAADARVRLRDSTIRAPYNVVIAQRLVDEGQSMTPGKPVVRFQSIGEMDITVDVPEALMTSDLHAGHVVRMLAEVSRAWNRRMNRNRVKINWRFDRKAARWKFGYKYKPFRRSQN